MSIFEVMGPVIIGPSSSHTTGPAKIGRIASLIFTDAIEEIQIYLHGSFAKTYKGHGTDKAFIGGILGFKPDDERLKDSLSIACENNIIVNFKDIKLKSAHPNTIIIILKNKRKELKIKASSPGGGTILIEEIDNYRVDIPATYPTLWILHRDEPGKVGSITSCLGAMGINIAFMKVFRQKRKSTASSVIELDQTVAVEGIDKLRRKDGIQHVSYIPLI